MNHHAVALLAIALISVDGGCKKKSPDATNGRYPTQIATGPGHACAVTQASTVYCWGVNASGQLGDGTRENRASPAPVIGLTGAVEVEVGEEFSCARKSDGTVLCWGAGSYGNLGNGSRAGSATASAVSGLAGVVDIELGNYHACAALADGSVRCWGSNAFGQSGQDPAAARDFLTPTVVNGVTGAVEVGAGQNHSCARTREGAVLCWGYNSSGQLGDGTRNQRWSAMPVVGLAGAQRLSTGNNHNCATMADASARCWGDGVYGQLGTGSSASAPVVFPLQGFRALNAGQSATCALMADGTVRCGGYNQDGRLGTGTQTTAIAPVQGISGAVMLGGGGGYACSVGSDHALRCWGTLKRISTNNPPVVLSPTATVITL